MFSLIASHAHEASSYPGSSASSVDNWLAAHPHNPSDYEHDQMASKKQQPHIGKPSYSAKKPEQPAETSVIKPRLGTQQPRSPRDSLSQSLSLIDSSVSRTPSSGSRSESPLEPEFDLELSPVSVEWLVFNTEGLEIPEKARALLKDIKRIGHGFRVIPHGVKGRAIEHMVRRDEDFAEEDFIGRLFDLERSTQEDGLDPNEVFDIVLEIERAALDCRNSSSPESHWNDDVRLPLIRLALGDFWENKGIYCIDVSTAGIHEASLLSGLRPTVKKTESKMVDLAMAIRPAEDLLDRIKDLLRKTDGLSINHTDAQYLRHNPIGISMKTGRDGKDEKGSNIKLGVWVSAHFAKLSQLNHGNEGLPPLPLLMIHGHLWDFMIAHKVNATRIEIYRDLSLGETRSILGIYQLLAAVRRLAQWMDEVLGPWFETNVL